MEIYHITVIELLVHKRFSEPSISGNMIHHKTI